MAKQGIDSEFVSLENIVDGIEYDRDGLEGQLDQSFYESLAKVVGERIRQCGNRVPVVTGFFGPVPGSLLRQVGRGYTDLLAALLAVGLAAEELQIWKEVDGIFTADPRKVPTARLISSITPEEAAELTYYGSEVVHPFTMEQVSPNEITREKHTSRIRRSSERKSLFASRTSRTHLEMERSFTPIPTAATHLIRIIYAFPQ